VTDEKERIVTEITGDGAVFTVRITGAGPVMAARGDLDLAAVDGLRAALDRLGEVCRDIAVIDLSQVSFLASVGIAELIAAAERATARGCAFAVIAADTVTRRPLEVLGLTETLRVVPDLDGAWASLAD